jgi:hypothetical protein
VINPATPPLCGPELDFSLEYGWCARGVKRLSDTECLPVLVTRDVCPESRQDGHVGVATENVVYTYSVR